MSIVNTDPDVRREIQIVDEAIKERQSLIESDGASHVNAERLVCIKTRALFTACVDAVLWSEDISSDATKEIRSVLERARECLRIDQKSIKSVSDRINDLDEFLSRFTSQ